MPNCYKNSGVIKLIRKVDPSQRYVAKCNDCGWESNPGWLSEAHYYSKLHNGK